MTISTINEWPIWGFMSLLTIAWITQRIIASREHSKKLLDTQMELYLETIPAISKIYRAAMFNDKAIDKESLYIEVIEVGSRFTIYGSSSVMKAYNDFIECATKIIDDPNANPPENLTRLHSDLIYHMCCDVHGEKRSNMR